MFKQMISIVAVAGLVLALAPAAQAMEFVTIGDPKNPDDNTRRGDYGGVPYKYRIGKYEVTIAEWQKSGLGDGEEDEWKESVGPGAPVVNVTRREAARFANWMTEKYGGGNPYYKDDGAGRIRLLPRRQGDVADAAGFPQRYSRSPPLPYRPPVLPLASSVVVL